MQATKKVTRMTSDGLVQRLSDGKWIGWKCTGCSTAYIADEDVINDVNQLVDYIVAMKASHVGCGA